MNTIQTPSKSPTSSPLGEEALPRLVGQGFVERVHDPNPRSTREAAQDELVVAQDEFESVRSARQPDPRFDRRMVDDSLRHAVSRVVAARRFLASLPAPR